MATRNAEQLERHRERQKLYVARNREKVISRQREYSSRPESKAKRKAYMAGRRRHCLIEEARKRAKEKGIEITITVSDISIPEICPVLDIPISTALHRDNFPSLDRRDNSMGYVPGNVFVISNRANRIKNDATLAEIEAIARYMRAGR